MDGTDPAKLGRTRKRFVLQRGLYTLRYEQAEDPLFPPSIYVSSVEPQIEFIWPPGSTSNALHRPGMGVVVKAEQSGVVIVEVVASVFHGSTDAEIRFEGLNDDADVELSTPQSRLTVTQSQPRNALIRGHLASIGDVTSEGDWLAGPDAPSRIEAVAIRLRDLPPTASLHYGARTLRQPASQPIRLVESGHWVGSKGKGEPIVGLHLELRYNGLPTHQLAGEVMFLGAIPRPFEGLSVDLQGLSGREPMIGLKLDLAPIAQERQAALAQKVAAAAEQQRAPSGTSEKPAPAKAPVTSARAPATASGPEKPAATASKPAVQAPAKQGGAQAAGDRPKRVRVFRA